MVSTPDQTVLLVTDLVLLLGFALRLARLVITDDLGQLLVVEQVQRLQQMIYNNWWDTLSRTERRDVAQGVSEKEPPTTIRVLNAVSCPWCIGFWLAALALASLLVAWSVGGTLLVIWRIVAGLFTLNYVAAHVGSSLGDFDEPGDSEEE